MIKPIHKSLATLALFSIYIFPAAAADKVVPETFVGWRLYHDTCATCHGVGGEGADTAPDLTLSLNRLTKNEFKNKVLNRYLIDVPGEEVRSDSRSAVRDAFIREMYKEQATESPMPEWKYNPIVEEHVDFIYQYLKERSTGAIGPGKPEIMKE